MCPGDANRRVGDPLPVSAQSNIAIVVPVFGDTLPLHVLIDRIRSWPEQPGEIIVVSATEDPELSAHCQALGCRYLESRRCRGAQLDSGARSTEAPVIWFLHADAAPHPSSLKDIVQTLADGAEGGHFRFRFTGASSWRKELIEWLVNIRVRMGGIPYGDQGLFVRREAYLECGGFPHQPLFEEVALVKKLRARKRFRQCQTPIGISPRRWERDGWVRRSLANRRLAIRYVLGTTAEQLARSYDQTNGTPAASTELKR